jgi:hypothetical protein
MKTDRKSIGILWHYTSGKALPGILHDGVIRVSRRDGVVWFSRRRDWDPATGAGAMFKPTDPIIQEAVIAYQRGGAKAVRELERRKGISGQGIPGGMVRVGVAPETAPMTWPEYARAAGLKGMDVRITEELDREIGSNPGDWRLSPVPVHSDKWLTIETRPGKGPNERWETYRAPMRGPQGRLHGALLGTLAAGNGPGKAKSGTRG